MQPRRTMGKAGGVEWGVYLKERPQGAMLLAPPSYCPPHSWSVAMGGAPSRAQHHSTNDKTACYHARSASSMCAPLKAKVCGKARAQRSLPSAMTVAPRETPRLVGCDTRRATRVTSSPDATSASRNGPIQTRASPVRWGPTSTCRARLLRKPSPAAIRAVLANRSSLVLRPCPVSSSRYYGAL